MANNRSSIKTELYAEINSDLSKFTKEFVEQLRATTPIRTGVARKGWRDVYRAGSFGKSGKTVPIAKNEVPYIGVLDSEKTSSQAPNGIVEVALRKTTRK